MVNSRTYLRKPFEFARASVLRRCASSVIVAWQERREKRSDNDHSVVAFDAASSNFLVYTFDNLSVPE